MEGRLIAYKLLGEGRVAPFSRLVWPEPGEWLEAASVDPCRSGIHACHALQLPPWLALGDLWEVELEDVLEQERKVVARRGRLVRRVDEWHAAAQRAFGVACGEATRRRAARAPELQVFADDIATAPPAPVCGYMAARAAELQEGPEGYDAERRRQAQWLIENLRLKDRADAGSRWSRWFGR
ncbi:MAG TPA: hypothetical protein VF101_08315 [Gaiellaceae bacterium]